MNIVSTDYRLSAEFLKDQLAGFTPKVAVVLGSGLGDFAKNISNAKIFSYSDIPHFPPTGVQGHAGKLTFGHIGPTPVAIMQGRIHGYEGRGGQVQAHPLRTLKVMGVDTVVLTCAAGSLRPDVTPGRLMMVTDHINLMGTSPLIGPNDDSIGPRFPNMTDAWDPSLRSIMYQAALEADISLANGVYIAYHGPAFETPAEVRMLKLLGGDAVGMSMVPDCHVARHAGMKVAGCAVITNMGVGLSSENVSHEHTLQMATAAYKDFEHLMQVFIPRLI